MKSNISGPTTPSKYKLANETKCVICNKISYKGDKSKSQIVSRDRAFRFLEAVQSNKDEVFTRIADLDTADSLIAADLFYHNQCMRKYLESYEKAQRVCLICTEPCRVWLGSGYNQRLTFEEMTKLIEKSQERPQSDVVGVFEYCETKSYYAHRACYLSYLYNNDSLDDLLNLHLAPIIKDLIAKKYGLRMSEMRDLVLEKVSGFPIRNDKLKRFVKESFGQHVGFCKPFRKNDSEVVYPTSISKENMIARFQVLDEVADTGKLLRERLKEVSFNLDDGFCDVEDLSKSLFSTRIPETVLTFLCSLMNLKKSDFLQNGNKNSCQDSDSSESENDDHLDDNDTDHSRRKVPPKILRAHSLYQRMAYMGNNGKKLTPLAVSMAHITYNKTKSRELLEVGNSLGDCVSYSTLRRLRFNLGARAAHLSRQVYVPRPRFFKNDSFTVAAMDNLDHTDMSTLHGFNSNHDSVMVVFQNTSNTNQSPACSLKVSDLQLQYKGRAHLADLDCQKLRSFYIKSKSQALPPRFTSLPFTYLVDNSEDIIKIIRASGVTAGKEVPTWHGSRTLVSETNLDLKVVGFLPILPHEITKIESVFTCLFNLKTIANDLAQPTLPVVCDEGVFRLVIQIYLERPSFFDNIFPMLGHFHMAKAALRCAGQYLRGSGLEDAFIECRIYGPKTLESVLTGKHYYRSFSGHIMLGEAIEVLKLEAFWQCHDKEEFLEGIEKLQSLENSLIAKKQKRAVELIENLKCDSDVNKLLDAYKAFENQVVANSEQCRYLCNYQYIVQVIKNLVRSDRDGDFLLGVKSVQQLCPIFLGLDGINYLRYASFYLELLKQLEQNHPALYHEFLKGSHVIKCQQKSFSAVSADMKLEQSIQRSAKSSGGIIGASKITDYVTEWSIIFHEVLGICNWLRDLTSANKGGSTENVPHHQLKSSKITLINDYVTRLSNFMRSYGNPFVISESDNKLKNFVTQIYSDREVAESYNGFFGDIHELYDQFHTAVYVEKTVLLSDKISKFCLKPVDYLPQQTADKSIKEAKKSERLSRLAIRTLLIAKDRCDGSISHILKHDLTPYNYLFEVGNEMTSPNKSALMSELKIYLTECDYEFDRTNVATFVDFMSFVRGQVFEKPKTKLFCDMVKQLLERIKNMFPSSFITHFIFDSYVDFSLKCTERISRSNKVKGVIHLARIDNLTPVPEQMKKFWNSVKNKCMLQEFAASSIAQSGMSAVLSGTVNNEGVMSPARHVSNGSEIPLPELACNYEEADLRIIPHIHWNLRNQQSSKRYVVISKDTDVFVYLLFYMRDFRNTGLEELWMTVGSGEKKTHLPMHRLAEKMGPQLCKAVLKAHIGTGCDYLSKIGTKKAALLAKPQFTLTSFGESATLDEHQINEAENYLARVFRGRLKTKDNDEDFDEMRVNCWRTTNSVIQLPPTSHSIREGHIRRWWFLYKHLSTLLNPGEFDFLDPTDYGWDRIDQDLVPRKCLNIVPDEYMTTCGCNKAGSSNVSCHTNRCKCKKEGTSCTDYCNCKNCSNRQST